MITRIAHVCIGASDLAATEKFYCTALGLKKKFEFKKLDKTIGFYLDAGNGNFIEVFEAKDLESGRRPALMHLCLEVDDLHATIDKIKQAGVEVTDRKMGCDNSWQAWVSDPSGVNIELHEYTPQSSQVTGKDCAVDW
jgi:catechol 2,3-dioxygenase-like lactoylglutathione lyase family enzyme